MNEVVILLGSNIQPQENIKQCLLLLKKEIVISAYSNVWITQSFGNDGPDFLNLAIAAKTQLDEKTIKNSIIKEIENKLGRIRYSDKYAPRTIDLDIIIFNDEVIDTDIWTKVFMAVPISELKPNFVHIGKNTTLAEIAIKLKSSQRVELFNPPKDFFPD